MENVVTECILYLGNKMGERAVVLRFCLLNFHGHLVGHSDEQAIPMFLILIHILQFF